MILIDKILICLLLLGLVCSIIAIGYNIFALSMFATGVFVVIVIIPFAYDKWCGRQSAKK